MLKITDLSKGYDGNMVLHDINMEVKKGEIHGLIGENGSGKTTLIKCITGIFKPEKGNVLLEGKPVYENVESKIKMGYVADNNPYFPHYPLGKMVKFFQDTYPKFDVEKCKDMNRVFHLDMNRRVSELSKGQKMSLAFMLTMSSNVDILIMDEPTSGLDAMIKKQVFDMLINEVEYRQLTVLISSHNLLELEKLCDSVTMIKKGRVAKQAEMDQVIRLVQKRNYVFQKGAPTKLLQSPKLVTYSNIGSIYTMVFHDMTPEEFATIEQEYHPTYSEELPVNLEEVFVYTHGGERSEE